MAPYLVSVLGVLLSIWATIGETTARIPFTPAGIRSINGKNLCDFEGEFADQFGVYLDGRKDNIVHYQQRNGIIAVFLLSRPTGRCGVVDAVLDLTPMVRRGENIEFKCYTAREGGATPEKWGQAAEAVPIIALLWLFGYGIERLWLFVYSKAEKSEQK